MLTPWLVSTPLSSFEFLPEPDGPVAVPPHEIGMGSPAGSTMEERRGSRSHIRRCLRSAAPRLTCNS